MRFLPENFFVALKYTLFWSQILCSNFLDIHIMFSIRARHLEGGWKAWIKHILENEL